MASGLSPLKMYIPWMVVVSYSAHSFVLVRVQEVESIRFYVEDKCQLKS